MTPPTEANAESVASSINLRAEEGARGVTSFGRRLSLYPEGKVEGTVLDRRKYAADRYAVNNALRVFSNK